MEKTRFEQRMRWYRQEIEQVLDSYLPAGDSPQETVVEAMRYALLGGGKRIRAALALAWCEVFCGDSGPAMPFAVAIEMIHAYSLIHDDLPCMDDDDLRRGRPSCHIQYGEAMALLAGDGLLTEAFRVMLDAAGNRDRMLRAALLVSEAAGIKGMVGGQVIDVQSEGREIDGEALETMHSLKTGALISAAARAGAIMGGCDAEELERVGAYARYIGLAFQIVDDILDASGDPALLGKPVGSDERGKKTTFIILYGRQEAEGRADVLVAKAKKELELLGIQDEFFYQLADGIRFRSN